MSVCRHELGGVEPPPPPLTLHAVPTLITCITHSAIKHRADLDKRIYTENLFSSC